MATLSVWRFDASADAAEASVRLQQLAGRGGAIIHDAATVSWERAARKPTGHELRATGSSEALAGSFLGLLFGLIFLVPLLGAAMGAATGAVAGPLTDIGIDDTFVNKVRDQVTPGTSALFVLSPDTALEAVEAELAVLRPVELILAHLSAEQERALRWVFTD
jgi:uncharacterized membrane protein